MSSRTVTAVTACHSCQSFTIPARHSVLFTPPHIPAGMTGIHRNETGIHRNEIGIHRNPQEWDRNPLESTGMGQESTGMRPKSTGLESLEWDWNSVLKKAIFRYKHQKIKIIKKKYSLRVFIYYYYI